MRKSIRTACILALLLPIQFLSLASDTSAVITSASTSVEFIWNAKQSRVEVKQKEEINYLAESYDINIPVGEFYNERTTINSVYHKLNGKVPVGFKPQYSYYSQDDIFYSDIHICYFPIYLKEKGNKATVVFEKTTDDPRYFTSIYFSEPYKVLERKVLIKIPRWMKLDLKEFNFGNLVVNKISEYSKGDDADIITYTIRNIPAEKNEKYSPGPSYLYPHLAVIAKTASLQGHSLTYFNTLNDLYSWYNGLVKQVANDDATLKVKAHEITKGLSDDIEKIKAVFYWVQNNIRYIAFEDGIAGFKPEKADEVLRKKYGDCKGMAHLTKSLLQQLGYDARLCWIGTNHIAYNYDTPFLAADNHMICAVNIKETTYFLDPTETYLPFNNYAERIQGRQVLIQNGETPILSKIPSTSFSQNVDYEKKVMEIAEGGTLIGTVNHLYKGEEKEYVLAHLKGIKSAEMERELKRYLSSDNENAIENLKNSNFDDIDGDLKLDYTIHQKSGITAFDNEYYIQMDVRKELNTLTIDALERKHDFWLPYKYNVQKEIELLIPKNYTLASVPPNLSISNMDYDFKISYTVQPGNVIYRKSIHIKNPRISRSAFDSWNKDIKKLNEAYNETLILKPKQ